jgi:hypothetical protein
MKFPLVKGTSQKISVLDVPRKKLIFHCQKGVSFPIIQFQIVGLGKEAPFVMVCKSNIGDRRTSTGTVTLTS